MIAIESDGAGSIASQEAILDSVAPGPIGWLHERIFGIVARRGIEVALRAAKTKLELGRKPQATS